MNTQSNAMAQSSLESQMLAPAAISATQRMYWSVRRELWENPSIYVAPLAVGGFSFFAVLLGIFHLPEKMRATAGLDPMKQHDAITQPYDFVAALVMATAMIVGVFYCLDALYGERRDRSVLFWKSLPVSDVTTVLAKASIPLVFLPLFGFAITVATQLMVLLLSSAVLGASGQSVATLWTHLYLFRTSLLLLYHLLTIHGLWWAPLWCWLLLVSAWARRAPILWAFLPPFALCYLEKIAFNTTHFIALLRYRFAGNGMEAVTAPGTMPMNPMTHITPGQFLISPGLWIGLAVAAIFLAAAVRLRRYQGPI